MLQKPSTFPSSTCMDLLRGDFMYVIYGCYFIYMCSSSISYMLTAGCLWMYWQTWYLLCCSRSSIVDLFCQDQTHWMNEWSIYIALSCVLLYTQSALQSYGGSLLNHHQCAASTWMMRRQPQDNGASALTTHQLQVEERVIGQSSGWGLLGGHDWQRPVKGIWPGHRGYTPTL